MEFRLNCKAFEIVDVLGTRVALRRFYLVRCIMKGTNLQSIDSRDISGLYMWPFARGVTQQV